jgi:hypothetical protein
VPIEIRNASPEYDQLSLSRQLAIPGILLVLLVVCAVLIFQGRLQRMAHAAAIRKAGPRPPGKHRGSGDAATHEGGYAATGHPGQYPAGAAYAPIISFVPVQSYTMPYPPGQQGYVDPQAYMNPQGYPPGQGQPAGQGYPPYQDYQAGQDYQAYQTGAWPAAGDQPWSPPAADQPWSPPAEGQPWSPPGGDQGWPASAGDQPWSAQGGDQPWPSPAGGESWPAGEQGWDTGGQGLPRQGSDAESPEEQPADWFHASQDDGAPGSSGPPVPGQAAGFPGPDAQAPQDDATAMMFRDPAGVPPVVPYQDEPYRDPDYPGRRAAIPARRIRRPPPRTGRRSAAPGAVPRDRTPSLRLRAGGGTR